uniref:Uncharacterized protein n=1 Tax=Rhizophora mucronata TaxID=61149 RepID=A0A2P2QWE4_RHIMU
MNTVMNKDLMVEELTCVALEWL